MTEPSRSQRALAAIVVSVIVLLAHARVWVSRETWDDVRYHTEVMPPRLAASEAILAGEPPTWWEGTGFGVPLLGDPSHGAAYPVTWLAPTPRAADLFLIFHLVWLALGIASWSRRAGASIIGCVVAGVLAGASGLAVAAGLRGALPALAQLPWIAWGAHGIANAESPRQARAGAAVLGLVLGLAGLSGQLGLFVDGLVLAIVLGARRRTLRWLVLAIVAGLAIASAQWIPVFSIAHELAGGPPVTPLAAERLVDLVVPSTSAATMWPGLFIGAAVLALAALARPVRRMLVLAGLFLVAAFVVGRGGAWPAIVGAPEAHLAAMMVLAFATAARGFDVVSGPSRARMIALGIAAVVTLAAAAIQHGGGDATPALANAVLAAACLVAALVVAWRVRSERRVLALAVLLVAPSVCSLGAASPWTPARDIEAVSPWVAAARSTIQATNPKLPLRLFRPVHMDDGQTLSVLQSVQRLAGTAAARHGLGAARTDDPARPRDNDALWLAASAMGGTMLARFGITLAILPASVVGEHGLTALDSDGNYVLVLYPAVPAASMVFEWQWVPDTETGLARLFPPGGRGLPAAVLVLEGRGAEQQDEPRQPEPCTVTRWARGAIDLTCAAEVPSYAAVSSTATTGWNVEVDGVDTPWVKADVLRRAVKLDAGAHVVSWRYIAPGSALGFALALTALVGLVVLAVLARPRRAA